MRNNYQIVDYSELGSPTVKVKGEFFHYQDLYELVGKNQFMTTFELTGAQRKGSETNQKLIDRR